VTDTELTRLEEMLTDGAWDVGGQVVRLTNLDKVLFPARDPDPAPITKRDLIRYYTTWPGS
jgi:bifunctional non-homologous end joining protein LigD